METSTQLLIQAIATASALLVAFVAGGFSLLGLVIAKEQKTSEFWQACGVPGLGVLTGEKFRRHSGQDTLKPGLSRPTTTWPLPGQRIFVSLLSICTCLDVSLYDAKREAHSSAAAF